ncbi:hypothetical protein [Micromonospora sp. NPDC051296]|uniref:hypothetical protein n=1 Tax=Micromonospora sp. NPDC051296 TaxID=3155046 RepID=UPI00344936E6
MELARVVAAIERGDVAEAIYRHEVAIRRDGWRRLPAEYRGAYLVDAARAYLLAGDLLGAGRMLVAADGIAPAEVRSRPSARTLWPRWPGDGPRRPVWRAWPPSSASPGDHRSQRPARFQAR